MADIKCEFKNPECLCQWCEEPCNNGLQCAECKQLGKGVHNCYMCTGFVGTYPWGTTSEEIRRRAEVLANERRK